MQKKWTHEICQKINERLTDRHFLRRTGLTKKNVQSLLKMGHWQTHIPALIRSLPFSCKEVLAACEPSLLQLAGGDPPEGWLAYAYAFIRKGLFSASVEGEPNPRYATACLFYLEVLGAFFDAETRMSPFDRTRVFAFATEEEIAQSRYREEYNRFRIAFRESYFYELMRIGKEIMPFDSLGHIAGVHYVAMHVARQLSAAGIPIDLGLISGAAAGHDIGKYGCRGAEEKRIPYLHYYYTDVWFKENNMSAIGHIAANHSTWDLELEDLTVESLVLIYADFRVKGNGMKDGKEVMHFFSLSESFDVILNKLDNVDTAKHDRYRHVYARLVDFEKYMEDLGVNTDFSTDVLHPITKKEPELLRIAETVPVLKNLSISHNILLMYTLGHETSFGDILEAARSAQNWKNSRAYISLFEEYFTYMTPKQKLMTLAFLYELLMHREGDIRRQAAALMGNILVHFDEEYRKEIPKDVVRTPAETDSLALWGRYLQMILVPDHRVTERHKRWLGYALKTVVESVLSHCKETDRLRYLSHFLSYYHDSNQEDATAFILLDSMQALPLTLLPPEELRRLLVFAAGFSQRDSLELRAAVLRFLKHVTDSLPKEDEWAVMIEKILLSMPIGSHVALQFLANKILVKWELWGVPLICDMCESYQDTSIISNLFLENMKAATPWVIKSIHIELLLDRMASVKGSSALQVATHLSNLVKVSEQVTVRHSAGEALLAIAPNLFLDQRNEVAIELTKGLEIGEYEFSKYIPQYLGAFATYLHPSELDEFVADIRRLLISTNERVVCVALDTLGVIIQHYSAYERRFSEAAAVTQKRKKAVLGMLLGGLADYRDSVNQEALLVIGQYLFGRDWLTLAEKKELFQLVSKKLLTLLEDRDASELTFFNNAACLNYVYRFISAYEFAEGELSFTEPEKIAFFPGTFDPFSLGHKGIATEIRDMGFTVYLALDEFSWSKKAQPHLIRREIIRMSVANEENIFLFPSDIPINIANPKDIRHLKSLFPDREVYMVAGSDVVQNASSYSVSPVIDSVHTMPHILFLRGGHTEDAKNKISLLQEHIEGPVLHLVLPPHLEAISSTRIRENIDDNRDISSLIDPVAQNYIYENSLYLREPPYKQILDAKTIRVEIHAEISRDLLDTVQPLLSDCENAAGLLSELQRAGAQLSLIFDEKQADALFGLAVFRQVGMQELYQELGDLEVSDLIRERASGKIILITGMYAAHHSRIRTAEQILFTETLSHCLAQDFTYAVFRTPNGHIPRRISEVLVCQGFRLLEKGDPKHPVYVGDMKNPITLFRNIETVIKDPFHKNAKVLAELDRAHARLQRVMTKLYPGSLVLSFHAGVMHHKLVGLITEANEVPGEPLPVRRLGKRMCVPYGKILRGTAIPNTVTKVLHTEKTFDPQMNGFSITQYPNYAPLTNQIRTIKSFNRPVILTDDLLHKGYRMRELDPLFQQEGMDIDCIIVGILSGRGKDLMEIQNRRVKSVYFLPTIRTWFVESAMYPFLGGDSLKRDRRLRGNLLNAVNFVLPYVMPSFLADAAKGAVYELSLVCLENTLAILQALEEAYQEQFERSLTLNRLNEVLTAPSCPDQGDWLDYDYHLAPSVYVKNDIERLHRLRGYMS